MDAGERRKVLTSRESLGVLALLENPPEPTAALKAAAERRKYRIE
jgi:uncharacterized protein (DUF1778 family)